MKVVVTLEYRFDRTPDGKVWTQTTFPYHFWMRYLEVFEHVLIVARVLEVTSALPDWKRADGEGVSFAAIPHYIGPWQYLLKARQIQLAARNSVGANDAIILRLSSQIANSIEPLLRQTGHPYGVEVVADPYDVFAPGSVKHPLSPFFRWWFPRQLRRQCVGASAAAYVTERALQTRYPPASTAFSTHYSSIEWETSALVGEPRLPRHNAHQFTLIFVGMLAQLYKAPNVLIAAVTTCVREGLDLKLILVGDGKHRSELEAQAKALGIGDRVCFRGQLTAGDAVCTELDNADLFVLPSYQEGLPRAMIEAMARALPCIGSTVGGIPELLLHEEMVPPGDVTALASKIREVVTNPERMARMSARNLEKAKEYTEEVIQERRNAFYRYVREQTELWLRETK
ncbi:MAG: glycosyltransferase family 4 protein [Microcoleus sp. CAN_BIN18]|nr:glycosyltransferase family 4 protein [Microcoleus sp. CAN_BIN18]